MEMQKIVLAIVGFLVLFITAAYILGSVSFTDSYNDLAYNDNNCSNGYDGSGLVFTLNLTDLHCYNSTTQDMGAASFRQLPMVSIFSPTSALFVVFMISLFALIIIAMKNINGKH